jgi:hypothetical protein
VTAACTAASFGGGARLEGLPSGETDSRREQQDGAEPDAGPPPPRASQLRPRRVRRRAGRRLVPDRLLEHQTGVAHVTEPLRGILPQASAQQPPDLRRRLRRQWLPVRLPFQDRRHRHWRAVAVERAPAREQLVEDAAERPDVASFVHRLPLQLLRRHVRRRAGHTACDRFAGCVVGYRITGPRITGSRTSARFPISAWRGARQPEVHDLDLAGPGHHDVRRFEVPVHEPLVVGFLEGAGNGGRPGKGLVQGGPSAPEPFGQGLAFQILHDDEGPAGRLAELVDPADGRVVERRGGARLAPNPPAGGPSHQILGRELEGHPPVQGLVAGEHFAHPARAQMLDDVVAADHHAGGQARAHSRHQVARGHARLRGQQRLDVRSHRLIAASRLEPRLSLVGR